MTQPNTLESDVAGVEIAAERGDILETAQELPAQVEVLAPDSAMRGRDLRRKLAGAKLLLSKNFGWEAGIRIQRDVFF